MAMPFFLRNYFCFGNVSLRHTGRYRTGKRILYVCPHRFSVSLNNILSLFLLSFIHTIDLELEFTRKSIHNSVHNNFAPLQGV